MRILLLLKKHNLKLPTILNTFTLRCVVLTLNQIKLKSVFQDATVFRVTEWLLYWIVI